MDGNTSCPEIDSTRSSSPIYLLEEDKKPKIMEHTQKMMQCIQGL